MLETISSINSTVNGIVWGLPATALIFGVGLYLSIRTGFLQFRKFGTVWQNTIGKLFHRSAEAGHGAVTPFQAVCTALAATGGTGPNTANTPKMANSTPKNFHFLPRPFWI